jgi:urease accessory protein
MSSLLAASEPTSWQASLALTFAGRDGATTMVRRGQLGPLAVQRPFFPEGREVCHVYVLHPPGGLVPGDSLELDVNVEQGAHALVTAPAATKVYRSDGRTSKLRQTLHARDGALLEWLPQDTILFNGARIELDTRIDLAGRAACIGWDILCFGRPACEERFDEGVCRQRLEVWRDGAPLVIERTRYEGAVHDASWGLRGACVTATLFATSPALGSDESGALLADLRGLPVKPGELCSATLVSGVVVMRYLGNSVENARILFEKGWRLVRPAIFGRPACHPRIWST